MLALLSTEHSLTLTEVETPHPKPNEVLIKVHAAGVNRADLLQRKGLYPPPEGESDVLGLEVAGEVAAIGSACEHTEVGERVFALLGGGGYAEYVVVDEHLLMPLPAHFSYDQGAAIAEVFLTAYQSIFWLGNLSRHDTLVIHAGAGGVGTAAIQVAKQIHAHVIATTSNDQKMTMCKALGADHVINYREHDFAERIIEYTHGKGANVIIDCIGAAYLQQNVRSLAMDGRLIMLALQGGSKIDTFNLGPIISKRLSIIGSTLRNRGLDYKQRLVSEFTHSYLPLLASNVIHPVIDQVIHWQNAEHGHQLIETNQTIGKVILTGM